MISASKIPDSLHGSHNRVTLRYLADTEKIALEDKLYKSDIQIKLPPDLHVLIISDVSPIKSTNILDHYTTIAEFSLSLLSFEGRIRFSIVAQFSNRQFTSITNIFPIDTNTQNLTFRPSITGTAVAQWILVCLKADKNAGMKRTRITAARYLRALDANQVEDKLLDLTISLESILAAQTEISFRFGICLSKVADLKGMQGVNTAKLLSRLYDVRSKITHGDPNVSNILAKLTPSLEDIYTFVRKILVIYMLFLSEKTYDEWGNFMHNKIFE